MKILIHMEHGEIQGVYSDQDDVEVEIIDVDRGGGTRDQLIAEIFYKTRTLHEVY